jgi:hypothetical protein
MKHCSCRYSVLSPQSCSLFLFLLSGCTAIGVAAYKLSPPPTIHPKYTGLAGQSIGVMVWADRGIRIDWPNLQLDLANSVQGKLAESKAKTVAKSTFPVSPASIVRYQKDHPQIEGLHVTEVAPQLGVTRLIYVEMDDFATRSDMAVDLFRGHAKATVRLIEVENGKGKAVYENHEVAVFFPPKGAREGTPNSSDAKIYLGTTDALGTEIAHLFIPYQVEE